MNDSIASLKKANDSLVEEIWRLRKIERAVNDFFESLQKNHGVKMSEIAKLAEAVTHECK